MLDKFWESIGTNLATRWLDHIFGPAFLFWAGGIVLYVWQTGWQAWLERLQAFTQFQQISWIIFGLLVLVFSSILVQSIRFPVLRLLEGYWPWPLNYIGFVIIAIRKFFFIKKYDKLRRLKRLEEDKKLSAKQRAKLAQLEIWAHWHPVDPEDLLATTLGNNLLARELSPKRKYGMDAVICWPRLWPLLPEIVRADVTGARSSLDRMVELWVWGLLFVVWTPLTYWAAVISLLWITVIYMMARHTAMTYGDLLEATFDLHRLALYDAIGWVRPASIWIEKDLGKQLTEFLWRGTVPVMPDRSGEKQQNQENA